MQSLKDLVNELWREMRKRRKERKMRARIVGEDSTTEIFIDEEEGDRETEHSPDSITQVSPEQDILERGG